MAKTLKTTTSSPTTDSIGTSQVSKVTTIAPEVTGPSSHSLFKPIRSRIRYIVSSSSLTSRNVTSTTTESTVGPVNRISTRVTTDKPSTSPLSSPSPSSSSKYVTNLPKMLPSAGTSTSTTPKAPTTQWNPEELHRIRVATSSSSKKNKANQAVTHAPSKLGNSGYNPFDDSGYGYGQDAEHLYPSRSTYAPYVYGSSNNLPDEDVNKKSSVLGILNRESINNWAKDVLTYFYAPLLVPAAISNALTNAPEGVEHETLFGRTVKSLKTFFAKPSSQVRKDTEFETVATATQATTSPPVSTSPVTTNSTSGLMVKLKNTGVKWYNKLISLPKVTFASLRRNSTQSTIYNGTDSAPHAKDFHGGNLNHHQFDEAVNE